MEDQKTKKRSLRRIFLLAGLGLLAFVLVKSDLAAVVQQIVNLGFWVIPLVSIYGLAFGFDSLAWALTLPNKPWTWRYLWNLWQIRLIGAAVNKITPLVGLGGEPLKAYLLKQQVGLGYDQAVASLLVFKTLNLIALLLFIALGLSVAITNHLLPAPYPMAAAVTFGVLGFGILVVTLAQRLRFASRFGGRLAQLPGGQRIDAILHHLEALDDQLVRAYRDQGARLVGATLLTFGNWLIAALEFYAIFWALGIEAGWEIALVVGAMVELASAAAFFVPANIGTQEAVLVLLLGLLGYPPDLGLAVSLVRRIRELAWLLWGGIEGWRKRNT